MPRSIFIIILPQCYQTINCFVNYQLFSFWLLSTLFIDRQFLKVVCEISYQPNESELLRESKNKNGKASSCLHISSSRSSARASFIHPFWFVILVDVECGLVRQLQLLLSLSLSLSALNRRLIKDVEIGEGIQFCCHEEKWSWFMYQVYSFIQENFFLTYVLSYFFDSCIFLNPVIIYLILVPYFPLHLFSFLLSS